jgi:hypothetical protein
MMSAMRFSDCENRPFSSCSVEKMSMFSLPNSPAAANQPYEFFGL